MSNTNDVNEPWYQNPRLVLGIISIFVLVGIAGWFTASEQEDPQFPYRNGFISLNANGMTISQIRDKAVAPMERLLSEIDEIRTYQARIKNGNATIDIELDEHIYNTDSIWQRIKSDIAGLEGSIAPINVSVNDRAQDTQGIVIAINGPHTLAKKRELALKLRSEIEQIQAIRSVKLVGDPQEQVVIDYSMQTMHDTGWSPFEIASLFENPEGKAATLQSNGLTTNLSPVGKIDSVEKIKNTQLQLPDGSAVPLSSIADIYYRTNPTAPEQFILRGEQVVGLAITLPANTVRVTEVGEQILKTIKRFNARYTDPPAEIVLFQPRWTDERKSGLLTSLATGCIGVAIVLMLMMSVRTAFVVVVSIPTIALCALGVFTAGKGVIHQMTIAGMVLSLGLMVDNSIVLAEKILQLIEQGKSKLIACKCAVKELYKPLATATVTTIAAFLPMLLATGSVADFIASIPILVILCISFSYLVALTLVPVLAKFTFKSAPIKHQSKPFFNIWGRNISGFALEKPKTVSLMFVAICIAMLVLPSENGEFFPKTSRNQAYVDIQLPYGTDIVRTAQTATAVSKAIDSFAEVTNVFSFSGSSGPRFYYNLVQQPGERNVARVVFEVTPDADVSDLVERLNHFLPEQFPSILVVARELGQGPPIESPIELRLIGEQRVDLYHAAEQMLALLMSKQETQNTRRAFSYGVPQLTMQIDQQALKSVNLTEQQIATFIAWQGSGLHASTLLYKTEPVDLIIQDSSSTQDIEQLLALDVINAQNEFFPLSLIGEAQVKGMLGVETRRNGREEIRVLSDVKVGVDEESLLLSLLPELRAIAEKHKITLELGGEFAESEEASNALLLALPAGLVLLFIALILQFNSYRLTLLVMASIPLGAIGAPTMLALVGVPFGFMSLLGVLALTGIVVNTAILLIDKAIQDIKRGIDKNVAIINAVETRLRAIMLTTVTTIVGMLPLTSSQSPLWPPLAWAVIGGLITSTILMLAIMPIWMNWLIDPKRYIQRINECNK
ncbi:efflux RND transporter permease subunit [Pseudoalteromonas luteoviolacea]|uniref:Acriflavin resistance protein n=1 Tax=Pseudoalteromonas luteoviolacea S4060-1 TaxID=1365257 RepID=A0A167LF04_9GAMM|nr:efflux RND transporter permease subunit [Pseudoalteromonas luteoviolacea]KZN64403.1 hypothetical protein N478_22165 [Pseudoalteromonas luteoviolacea S4060-1]